MRLAALLVPLTALPAFADEIVPRDGIWTTTPVSSRIGEGCPESIRPMLEPMLSMMDRPTTQQVEWGGTFDPQAMAEADGQQGATWTRLDANTWEAVLRDPDRPLDDPAIAMRMEAVAPDRVEASMTFDVGQMMGPDATDLMGDPVDPTGCTLTMEAVSTHDG
jgi:hypothetical protein